jgi:iron(III) transport system ATP-binding protein
MVTHDQEEAMGVSDRIVVMSRGRIEQVGTPEESLRRPASAFVAGFVGRSSRFDAIGGFARPACSRRRRCPIAAYAARPLLYGARVTCFIRPEHVRLDRADAAPAGAIMMRG